MVADRAVTRRRVAVVSDDLTGALDAGLQLATCGLDTRVSLGLMPQPAADAMVLNTATRAAERGVALTRVRQAATMCTGRLVYKKLDSTLRGHVGPECVALRDALGYNVAVIAPAFVETGRTVEDGRLLVDGVPVHKTGLANDPQWPAHTADLVSIVRRGIDEPVALIGVDTVRSERPWLMRALNAVRLAVVETQNRDDLDRLAHAIAASDSAMLPCGSAGLAASWADAMRLEGEYHPIYTGSAGPVLLVSGSLNAATRSQLDTLRSARITWCELDPPASAQAAEDAGHMAAAALLAGDDVALTTSFGPSVSGVRSATIAGNLGRAAQLALSARPRLAGLVLTGGDTALEVGRALGITSLEIIAAIEPGIPGSLVADGPLAGLAVVTKAGGFGSPRALLAASEWIRHGATR